MRKTTPKLTLLAGSLAAVIGGAMLPASSLLADTIMADVDEGKKLAFSVKKGNCLACHIMPTGELPGNIAPPLIGMKARYPDRDKLRDQIWDATAKNPVSLMPPFGKYKILSDTEIDSIVDYVWSL